MESGMRVLVVGSGGREHALAWKIARSPRVSQVLAAPGSHAIARGATCFPAVRSDDPAGLVSLCRAESIDLAVIGPEAALAAGVSDRLREAGFPVFGPSAAAARLETSKSFAKRFMARHGIPTAGFEVFDRLEAAQRHVRERGGPCVIKADGLAAGKGVAVCDGPDDALAALDEMMEARRFGAAGERVVIEDRLVGEEVSFYAVTDGETITSLAAAQDHKRALDGDRGENTGGMGACSPPPGFPVGVEKRVIEEIVHPTVRGMAADGCPYTGVLYVGLMIAPDGSPRVVEYNARFGDPETQPLVLRMEGDLALLLEGAAHGKLGGAAPLGWSDAAVCVVLASGGYPREFRTGLPIEGLEEAERDSRVVVFHAGTRRDAAGRFLTAGGRVLGVTARGATLAEARRLAYAAADQIRFEGMHLRRDIAARGSES
jgi:phosphoribosylamine--glycine ligase